MENILSAKINWSLLHIFCKYVSSMDTELPGSKIFYHLNHSSPHFRTPKIKKVVPLCWGECLLKAQSFPFQKDARQQVKMRENAWKFQELWRKKITFWTAEFEQPNNNLFAEFRGEFSQVVSHGTHIRFPRYWGYTKRDTPPREVRPRMVRRAVGWFQRELSTNKFLKIGLYPREAPKSLLRCS